MAALGKREGPGPALSAEEQKQARRQALGVWVKSISTGVACTLLVWWLLR